ncbi:hypothetical protein ACFL5O_06130 [Myxococcota bacterium]
MGQVHYRHTQTGWVLIVTLSGLALLFGFVLAAVELSEWSVISAGGFLLLLLLSATLTVSVDTEQIRLQFGVGLIRKRFALRDVRHFSAVRNPWYLGWGIHFYPGGSIYNVSGLGGVQLVLENGKRIRIGTDQPESLRQAIEQILGKPQPLTATDVVQGKRSIKRGLILSGVIMAAIAGVLGGLLYLETQPPKVTLDARRLKVESFIYGEEFVLREITHVSLQDRIPRIRVRTNGSALGRILRGHFRLDTLGEGQLFIEYGRPPYLLVRRGNDYLIANFEDPVRTQALYQALLRQCPGAVGDGS